MMDPNHQTHQLHRLAQPLQPPPPPQQQQQQQHQAPSASASASRQRQRQQLDPTMPQDVLAEARKNLQVLIDSGLSKDLLHQWVDDSLSLQLSFPGQPPPAPAPLLSHPVSFAQPRLQSRLQSRSRHDQGSTLAAPPPPPIPTLAHRSPVPSASATPASTSPPSGSVSGSIKTSPAAGAAPLITIKSEPSFSEDVSQAWAAVLAQAPASAPGAPVSAQPVNASHDQAMAGVAPPDFIPRHSMPFLHRPRISVSSTSSGSSGHASIWSANSARSSLSWQSTSSNRTQAQLPMTPMTSAAGAHLINSAQAAAAVANNNNNNKLNIYWCTSCETSFKRKYDWKRHEDEFHERWRKYPCPEPGCNRSFWGSNSFNQHHKQCHGCKTCPHAEKVVKFLRKRKYWACGFCSALHPARERHVEHVARHFESGLTKGDWMHSRVIYGLLHQPLIHGAWDALVASKQSEHAGRRPQFSWHPSKTGRAQGFLEKESPGQLQDLLEFFSGDEGGAQWIVTVAYDLSDIVYTSPTVHSQQFSSSSMAPPPPYQQHPDPRMSFTPLPSQAPLPPPPPQQMLASPVSSTPSPFDSSPYRTSAFASVQAYPAAQQPSPESSTRSPMVQSPFDKRDLPPVPPHSAVSDGMMDFEYSSVAAIFGDWESIGSSTLVDSSSQHQETPADWGMSQYYGDPRVTS